MLACRSSQTKGIIWRACMICSLVIPIACASRKARALDDKRSTKVQNLYSFLTQGHSIEKFSELWAPSFFYGFQEQELLKSICQYPDLPLTWWHCKKFYIYQIFKSIPIKIENYELLIGHDGSNIRVYGLHNIQNCNGRRLNVLVFSLCLPRCAQRRCPARNCQAC